MSSSSFLPLCDFADPMPNKLRQLKIQPPQETEHHTEPDRLRLDRGILKKCSDQFEQDKQRNNQQQDAGQECEEAERNSRCQ
ncbi:MAG TPA: hypothetical protein VHU83_11530 [Bryobacteraceae bacterium]|nr:hypothetical protein [Bryobacteraceae bacterium]